MKIFHHLFIRIVVGLFLINGVSLAWSQTNSDSALDVIRSLKSGPWSAPETWEGGRVPGAGDRVLILGGHHIHYAHQSNDVIRAICISGSLSFSTKWNTELNVGLIRIEAGDIYSEEGFDCLHPVTKPKEAGKSDHGHHHQQTKTNSDRPALLIGTPQRPIPHPHTAKIRLHFVEGMNRETCPAIVCCGGRMDIHGAPMKRTWVKMTRTADAGANRLFLDRVVDDWRVGDTVLVTGSGRQEFSAGRAAAHVNELPASEVRKIQRLSAYGSREIFGSPQLLELNAPLERSHVGGREFSVEVANLSRNVVIESAKPEGVRGHTMYHHSSKGSISYAEFRHLGKHGVLGKYPIHFHLVEDSMRGSSVIGASVWDSHNRWITIHGTQYLLVRDCIGYQSVGHGFFLEDGTEVYNVLDRNLAVQAMIGKPLPKQVLSFDLNDGAGFWWANSHNSFTRNIAVECDQYGFRFEAEKTKQFDPVLSIRQPDGSKKKQDIRTLPFVYFADNETHCQRRFGFNLGGIRGMTHLTLTNPILGAAYYPFSVSGSVDGVGPDQQHPFQVKNMKVWDAHWALHSGTPSLSVDGLNIFDCNYGIWRSVMGLHQYDNLSFRKIHAHAIFFPTGGNGPEIHLKENGKPSYPATKPVDDAPPITVITRADISNKDKIVVQGIVVDNQTVKQIHINQKEVPVNRQGYSEWKVELPREAISHGSISVFATDDSGNKEKTPHEIRFGTLNH